MVDDVGFAGVAMCLPHVYSEIYQRVGTNTDPQSELVMERLGALVKTVGSYMDSDDGRSIVTYPDQNHTAYVKPEIVKQNMQTHIAELLDHVCVIGEPTARLLADMYVYVEFMEGEIADGPSKNLVEYVVTYHNSTGSLKSARVV